MQRAGMPEIQPYRYHASRNDRRCGPERTDSLTCFQRQGFFWTCNQIQDADGWSTGYAQVRNSFLRGCRVCCIGHEGKILRCLRVTPPAVHASTKVSFTSTPGRNMILRCLSQ
jgi:hypothetical protein